MLFINPPFGNYLNLPNTTSITGSFTLQPREGLIMQIIKTLRYSFEYNGWVNKIGLKNKGIDWALTNIDKNNIISVAILHEKEIPVLNSKIPMDRNIELNVSCPNAEKKMINSGLSCFLNDNRKWCIIKVSPKTTHEEIDNYYNMGFRQFHCCNTLPVKEGGLSGSSLIPYTSEKISYLKKNYPETTIIAGGGIQHYNDILHYNYIGAHHHSVSTLLFNPYGFLKLYYKYNVKK
tara:strand:+ start:2892 stop:3593 length:702 start_codon:yes stop_codon:yes gene_type:complete